MYFFQRNPDWVKECRVMLQDAVGLRRASLSELEIFFAQTEFLWEKRHKAPFFISHRNSLDCSIQMLNIVWI